MIYLVLESADVSLSEVERHDESNNIGWESLASTQGQTEEAAKALMLENMLEMLNNDDFLPTNEWLRLVFYGDDHKTITKVETF